MIQEFTAAAVKQLNDEIERLRDAAGDGDCKTWEAYQHLTGEIQGLLRARLLIKDLAKKAENDDDSDD